MANRAYPLNHTVNLDDARAELRRALHRSDELREMAEAGPTRRGCCDDCHHEPVDLYDDPDEPQAGWQYCPGCLGKRRQSNAQRIADAQARCRRAGGTHCRACGDFYDKTAGSCGCCEPPGVQ